MVSKKDLADFIEDFVVETPNWALFGMALLFVFFGWFIDHASFVQRFGGVLVAVILVNAFYSFDVFSNESNKTLIQVMLIFAAVGGLVASEVLKSVLIAAIGDLVIIQVLGIIAVVSRISVNITEAYSEIDRPNPRNRSPAIVFDGRNDTYGMYTAGLIAVILPEILEFLWLGEYFDWMSWVCLLIACTGFGAVYVYRD
ncbi:hypothetical protein BV210_18445 (plasmid) [Halorientalis sp. IM1011]|uniref:hypothetical protein n=1 Tax=Halorientalis sp. IM1011 TaxID=1932360 RepID=UPI00097CD2E9|nr:hypothetical protein [Halorientalis sp. IM1011]AQL44730.1 hypothetical protein BV210_18445 [Halorientalis sp. IM1011]